MCKVTFLNQIARLDKEFCNFYKILALEVIEDPIALGQELDHVVGVVEHGLFNQMVDKVIVAGQEGVQILTSTKAK